MPKEKNKNGFTMIELLAVLVILGIIMAITIPTISYFLKGNSKDYYDKLEKTVSTSGQDFFNDYRGNLPRDIGHVKKITVQTLQNQKYVTEIKGFDKKTCDGEIVVQKLTNGNYSYTACLKCEKKSDGTYGYVSDTKECGYSEENNNKYIILIEGLGDKTSVRLPQAQAYTVPNAKVYVNGQPLANSLKPMPGVIDVNVLTTYNVYYTFRTLVKQLEIKIYDPKKPVLSNITATSGGTNYTSNTYSSKDVRVNLSGTDWTTSSVYGSGIDHILYQVNGESPRKIIPVTSDNRTYTTSFDFSANGTYNISTKAVDKEGNIGDSKTFIVKIDKTTPTAPVITGGSTSWISTKRTISVSRDATSLSGIKNYQYYISTSSTTQSGGSWTNLSSGVKQVDITTEGTRYIFFRAVSNSGIPGLVSNSQTTRIDKSKPTAPVITGGSTSWISTKRTISVSRDATSLSGIKNYQYYISTSSTTQSGGSWTNLSSGVKQVDITTEGTRYIFFRTVSNTGVIGLVSNNQPTRIDKSKPTAPVITGGSTSWISTKRIISVSKDATVQSGIKNYQYYISTSSTSQSGGSWTNLSSGVKQIDITTSGTRYIFFRAISNTGIAGTVSNSQTTRIDKSKPTAPTITGGSTTWISTKRTISVSKDATVSSGIKNYQYYISTSSTTQSGGSWTNLSSGVKQIDITTSGTRYIFFRAVSNSGVIGLVSNSQTTRIDRGKPTTPSITGGSSSWINTKRTIRISTDATATSGIKNYQYYISTSSTSQSGGSWTNLSSGVKQVDITIEGSRYIFFRAVSNTGAVGAVSNVQTTKIDKTKPVITGVDGAGKWITTRTRVQITATDSLSGISAYSYDNGATWKANNYSTFSNSTTMKLAVKDVAGNITYGSYSIKVDKNPPDIKWSTSDKWSNTSSYIKVETSDSESGVNRVEYQLDNCYSSKPGTLVTGSTFTTSSYTNCLKAYDNAGNVRSILVYAKIDKDAPYTPYISDSAKQETLNNGYISVECSKNEMYSYGNNKCVLTKRHSSGGISYWMSHLDKGNSGIGYKEVSYLTNGVVVSNWKRYGINETDAGYTHNSPCSKAGQCSKRVRYIDNAGNVGPGYLEIDFVDVY